MQNDRDDIKLALGCPFCAADAIVFRMPGDWPTWRISCDHDENCMLYKNYGENEGISYQSIYKAKEQWYWRNSDYCDIAWEDMKVKYNHVD